MKEQQSEAKTNNEFEPTVNGWLTDHAGEWEYRMIDGQFEGTKRKVGMVAKVSTEIFKESVGSYQVTESEN